jgi:putative Ca2+/H+ antiporter (TMEM165/GDT1 family)
MMIDWKILGVVFVSVFIAEMGDKTQLATMLFAADKEASKWTIFFGASVALVATSAIGVLVGSVVSEYVNEKYLHFAAGAGFIIIGVWTLWKA